MKTYLTFLSRNRLFTLVNVLGLSVSLMFVLLIGDMVVRELTVGQDIEDRDEIYVLTNNISTAGHVIMGDMLMNRYPEIKSWSALYGTQSLRAMVDDKKLDMETYVVKPDFFSFMGMELVEGSAEHALIDSRSIVLTESGAHRLFGAENPMGQRITIEYEGDVFQNMRDTALTYTVSGIARDFDNSLFKDGTEAFLPFEAMEMVYRPLSEKYAHKGACCTDILARFHEGTYPDANSAGMTEFLGEDEHFPSFDLEHNRRWEEVKRQADWSDTLSMAELESMRVHWLPLSEVYFSGIESHTMRQSSVTNVKILTVFGAAGLIILLMAVFNYVSMSMAQTANRAKEMATRRLLGTQRRAVFWRMIGEALMLTTAAFLLAYLLALAAEPFAMNLLQTRLDIAGDLSPAMIGIYVLFLVVVALLSGSLPATVLSAYDPIDVVRGTFRRRTKTVYLRTLYIVQSGMTVALLACSLYSGEVLRRILDTPLGYTYGNILQYDVTDIDRARLFRTQAEQLPFVKRVGFAKSVPVDGVGSNSFNVKDVHGNDMNLSTENISMDTAAVAMFGFHIRHDRHVEFGGDVRPDHICYFSRSVFDTLGLDAEITDVIESIGGEYNYVVNGEFDDVICGSVLHEQRPEILFINDYDTPHMEFWFYLRKVLVETIDGNLREQKAALDSLFYEVNAHEPFVSTWYADEMNAYYEDIFRIRKIVTIFTAVALLITLLGLTAMSLYFIAQRKRDMAIRKVFGSDARRELLRLMRFAMTSLAVGLLIAVPLMWAGIRQIDRIVEYDMPFPWWVALAAFAIVAAVSLLSVWLISRHAVRENPVENLKTE